MKKILNIKELCSFKKNCTEWNGGLKDGFIEFTEKNGDYGVIDIEVTRAKTKGEYGQNTCTGNYILRYL